MILYYLLLLLRLQLQEAVCAAFNAANQYAKTFEPIRDFYRENQLTDLDLVREQDHGTQYESLFSTSSFITFINDTPHLEKQGGVQFLLRMHTV